MAVNTTPPLPKSQPDIARINTYTGTTITVTKHTGPRNTVGQSVVPTQQMPVKQILDLMTSLPLTYGPGFYHFTCSDTGGTGDDTWMVRLGPPEQEASMSGLGSGFPSPPGGPPAPVGPLSEGVRQIGPGYYYDENLGTLVTPWREIVQWRPGEPLPKAPTNASHLSLVPPNAQPGQWPQMPGWGSFPATDDSRAIKEMEARLADERRQREREDDNRRRQEEKDERRREQEEQRRRDDARDTTMMKLFESLNAKPTGPSDSELMLRREIEETKRRLEEQTREEARRREDQAREDRYREDARIQREKTDTMMREMREKDSHKPDPLMTLMGTIMTSTQAQASESVRAVREAAAVASSANERHTSQIMEAMTRDKTGASEMTKQMLEGSKTMMEMQSSFYQQMLEQANSGGAPWYASAIQGALEKIGPIANAVATRNQQAQQVQMMPPPRQPPAARGVAPGTVRPIPSVASPPNLAGLPPAIHTGERPEGVEYDATTETFIVPGGPGHPGYRVPSAYVGQHGWNETLRKLAQQSAPSPVAAFAGTPAPTAGPPTLTVVPPPAAGNMNGAAPAPVAPKKGRGRKAPPPPPVDPAVPPPADPQRGYSRDEMQGFDHETMLAIVRPFDDATLFGPELWPYVQQLRADAPEPMKAAEYVLQGKAQLAAAGKGAPAMDLLEAAQIDVFVERLFPEAPDEYQEAVAKAIASAMGLTVLEEAES